MKAALFDILTGEHQKSEVESIKAHLYRLLNARAGSLQHMPDYGLPDVTELYQELPYSITVLSHAITTVIEKYEPRLKNVMVKHQPQSYCGDWILRIEILARTVNHQTIDLTTYFNSSGEAVIY